ncbi:hypothetical protein DYI37_03270 [Fulvimarina endophytica]|uniref:Uncharacterized protein n=1 Tax=Fulvimarina endophytica TaxID=2293836 RepID=A0A371XB56_9HYPH|nr:hypothetical protein DYI37_03270 [Fulvimarina endophytica]
MGLTIVADAARSAASPGASALFPGLPSSRLATVAGPDRGFGPVPISSRRDAERMDRLVSAIAEEARRADQ